MSFNLYKRVILFIILTLALLPFYLPVFLLSRFRICKRIMLEIRKIWSLAVIKIVGVKLSVKGERYKSQVYVSNHVSWIDILVLNAILDIVFVSKREVKSWPGLGLLAILAKTIFIERNSLTALTQKDLLEECLKQRQSICFFPEGTSTDGLNVKPFKSALFSICIPKDKQSGGKGSIQPITLKYHSPFINDPGFYSFWREEETIFQNIRKILSSSKVGSVEIVLHAPLFFKNYEDRKALSLDCFEIIKNELISRRLESS